MLNHNWRRRNIVIGSVEPLVVYKILRRYIGIVGVEPIVVDKILKIYIGIGNIEPLVVNILRLFWSNMSGSLGGHVGY